MRHETLLNRIKRKLGYINGYDKPFIKEILEYSNEEKIMFFELLLSNLDSERVNTFFVLDVIYILNDSFGTNIFLDEVR